MTNVPKIITKEELETFTNTIPQVVREQYITYWQNFIYCASHAGLRREETRNLKVQDIRTDGEKPMIVIRDQKNNTKNQYLVINTFLAQRLSQHLKQYAEQINYSDGHIFFSLNGQKKPMSPATVQNTIEKIRTHSGLHDTYNKTKSGKKLHRLSYHTFRHYYCQTMMYGKNPQHLQHVQTMMRHRNITSTLRYAHQSTKLQNQIVDDVWDNPKEKQILDKEALKQVLRELLAEKN